MPVQRKNGAGGFLLAPGLVGFDAMCKIVDDDKIALPIMNHLALLGSFTTSPRHGISHFALYGQFMRLAGPVATIIPNWGGRFAFSHRKCKSIVDGVQEKMGRIKSVFPTTGGRMTIERIPESSTFSGVMLFFSWGRVASWIRHRLQ